MIAIIVYLGAMLYVGYRCSKNNHDTTDFYLGGRKLGPLVTAMSAEASDMSSWLLMGLPGLAYLTGIADAGWTAIGLAIGTYINWRIVAKRIRRYTLVAGNSITLPSFFSNRQTSCARSSRSNIPNTVGPLPLIIAPMASFFSMVLFISSITG